MDKSQDKKWNNKLLLLYENGTWLSDKSIICQP